jgi:hypothetical protein
VCLKKRNKNRYEANKNRVENTMETMEYPDIVKVIIMPMMTACVNQNKFL